MNVSGIKIVPMTVKNIIFTKEKTSRIKSEIFLFWGSNQNHQIYYLIPE